MSSRGSRVVVTGASGFVGQHLIAHLLSMGDDVIATSHGGVPSASTARALDITDADATIDLIGEVRPHAIYHLAALTSVGESWQHPRRYLRTNIEGTYNMLEAAQIHAVERVLVVGSAEEYGTVDPSSGRLNEEQPLRPTSPYATSKVAAEHVAMQWFASHRVPVIRVRAFNHTGPGQSDRFIVSAVARRIAEAERDGHPNIAVGSLSPIRDFTDVRDVVQAYRLLVERGSPGEVYNVCSGAGVSMESIVDELLDLSTRPLQRVTDPALVRPIDVPRLIGDPSKIAEATGWMARIRLRDTLADVIAWWRAHLQS